MSVMEITLTPEHEALIKEKIQSGLYNSASEVINDSLRLLKEQDELKRIRIEELKKEVMLGVEQIRRGEFRTYNSGEELAEEIIREGLKELKARGKIK